MMNKIFGFFANANVKINAKTAKVHCHHKKTKAMIALFQRKKMI
jgi:hypothetical protein